MKLLTTVVALAVTGSAAVATPRTALVHSTTDEAARAELQMESFLNENPDDLIGFERLVQELTGEPLQIYMPGVGRVSASEAVELSAEGGLAYRVLSDSSDVEVTGSLPDFSPRLMIRSIAGKPRSKRFIGAWNFPGYYAGQLPPEDVATLSFLMSDCVEPSNYTVITKSATGTNTGLGYLRTANVASKAPVWNITDYVKGFENQADYGNVRVTLSNRCGRSMRVGADFSYEHNQKGSVVSVSAAWGLLEVGYQGLGKAKQMGTEPQYITF